MCEKVIRDEGIILAEALGFHARYSGLYAIILINH